MFAAAKTLHQSKRLPSTAQRRRQGEQNVANCVHSQCYGRISETSESTADRGRKNSRDCKPPSQISIRRSVTSPIRFYLFTWLITYSDVRWSRTTHTSMHAWSRWPKAKSSTCEGSQHGCSPTKQERPIHYVQSQGEADHGRWPVHWLIQVLGRQAQGERRPGQSRWCRRWTVSYFPSIVCG